MKTEIGFIFLLALTIVTADHHEEPQNNSNPGHHLCSCKSRLNSNVSAPSGVYSMSLSRGGNNNCGNNNCGKNNGGNTNRGNDIQVYCEMGLNGGGYTFLSPESLACITSQELASWFTDKTSFLMRVRKTNGAQPYAVLEQLVEHASVPLKLGLSEYNGYSAPNNLNEIGAPYLYYGFVPANQITIGTVMGLNINGFRNIFTNCDSNPNNQFTLFPNFEEVLSSIYRPLTPAAVCTAIFANFKPNPSARVMPDTFFMFGETYWSGCGCYVQTDQQTDILSWSIGFR